MAQFGKLFLVPCPIGNISNTIPEATLSVVQRLKHYVAERAKTARRFLKTCNLPFPLQEIQVVELEKHQFNDPFQMLEPCRNGYDMGILSEAGCPGIADPGADIVLRAHELGIEVIPLVGPSSVLLSLMASGLNGQKFIFHGYLGIQKDKLKKELKKTEQHSVQQDCTQIAIETPYRNEHFIKTALENLQDETLFTIACQLADDEEYIKTQRVKKWKELKLPNLHKKPAVFCWKLNK